MQVALNSLTGHNSNVYCKLPSEPRVDFQKVFCINTEKITIPHINIEILHEILYKPNYQNFRNFKIDIHTFKKWKSDVRVGAVRKSRNRPFQGKWSIFRPSKQGTWKRINTVCLGWEARQQALRKSQGSDMTNKIIQKTRTFFDGSGVQSTVFFPPEYEGETCSPRTPSRQHEITGRET